MNSAPPHHPPMPPTKAMGAITQNRRGRPTATPCKTSWYSGVVRFGRARERRHRLLGCIFCAKFGRRGGLIPWPNRDGRTISTVPLDATSQRHHKQLATALARAETAGGWGGGFAFRRGESMYFRRSGGWATGAILAPCGRFRLFHLAGEHGRGIEWRLASTYL